MLLLMSLDSDEERDRVEYLYNSYSGLLMRKALYMLKTQSLAEEALTDTFIEAMMDNGKIFLKSEIDFRSWSVVVIERKCLDILRKEKRQNSRTDFITDEDEISETSQKSIEETIIQTENYEKLTAFIGKLSDENRLILRMKYFEDMSIKQIACTLGMTVAQVNSRLERTRRKLREMFESEAD
jgi:RNA polymerase sigma-70 factor (ECF subfamily)